MPTAIVTSKGQVTIPKAVREILRVSAGDEVDFVVTGRGDISVHSVSLDVRELRGLLKRSGRPAVSVEEMNAEVLDWNARKK